MYSLRAVDEARDARAAAAVFADDVVLPSPIVVKPHVAAELARA